MDAFGFGLWCTWTISGAGTRALLRYVFSAFLVLFWCDVRAFFVLFWCDYSLKENITLLFTPDSATTHCDSGDADWRYRMVPCAPSVSYCVAYAYAPPSMRCIGELMRGIVRQKLHLLIWSLTFAVYSVVIEKNHLCFSSSIQRLTRITSLQSDEPFLIYMFLHYAGSCRYSIMLSRGALFPYCSYDIVSFACTSWLQ